MNGRYDLYRAKNPDGSTRDALVGPDPEHSDRVLVLSGKSGKNLTVQTVPVPDGSSQDAQIQSKVQEFVNDGYVRVGVADVVDRRVSAVHHLLGDDTVVDWELAKPLTPSEFAEFLRFVSEALGDEPIPGQMLTRDDHGLMLSLGQVSWSFGTRPTPDGTIDAKNGRGGGRVSRHHGPVPLLVLATLAHRYSGRLVLADKDGNQYGRFGYREIRELATGQVSQELFARLAENLSIKLPAFSSLPIESTGMFIC